MNQWQSTCVCYYGTNSKPVSVYFGILYAGMRFECPLVIGAMQPKHLLIPFFPQLFSIPPDYALDINSGNFRAKFFVSNFLCQIFVLKYFCESWNLVKIKHTKGSLYM